jgi:hypothetical protein
VMSAFNASLAVVSAKVRVQKLIGVVSVEDFYLIIC